MCRIGGLQILRDDVVRQPERGRRVHRIRLEVAAVVSVPGIAGPSPPEGDRRRPRVICPPVKGGTKVEARRIDIQIQPAIPISAVEAVVFAPVVDSRTAGRKVMPMVTVGALDVAPAAPLGEDAAVVGTLHRNPPAAAQPIMDVHPPPGVMHIAHPAIGASPYCAAAPGHALVASPRRGTAPGTPCCGCAAQHLAGPRTVQRAVRPPTCAHAARSRGARATGGRSRACRRHWRWGHGYRPGAIRVGPREVDLSWLVRAMAAPAGLPAGLRARAPSRQPLRRGAAGFFGLAAASARLACIPAARQESAAAVPYLMALRRSCMVIGSSFLVLPALHPGRANALLNVADFSVGESHLHVLVIVDFLRAQLGCPSPVARRQRSLDPWSGRWRWWAAEHRRWGRRRNGRHRRRGGAAGGCSRPGPALAALTALSTLIAAIVRGLNRDDL